MGCTIYSQLYRSGYADNQDLAAGFYTVLSKVSENAIKGLERSMGKRGICAALQGVQDGSGPGIDGLTVEFYKSVWSGLGVDLMAIFNESLTDTKL